jgi:hypothetical protein
VPDECPMGRSEAGTVRDQRPARLTTRNQAANSRAEGQVVWRCRSSPVTGGTASLISSLIHVRIPASINVYCRAQSRIDRLSYPILDGHPSS